MASPTREGKKKSARERKNPGAREEFAELRKATNAARGRQVYDIETKKYSRVK